MYEMTPSRSSMYALIESDISEYPADERLEETRNDFTMAQYGKPHLTIKNIEKCGLTVPFLITKKGMVMKDVRQKIQTLFYNTDNELCVVIYGDSYINIAKYEAVLDAAYHDLIAHYESLEKS